MSRNSLLHMSQHLDGRTTPPTSDHRGPQHGARGTSADTRQHCVPTSFHAITTARAHRSMPLAASVARSTAMVHPETLLLFP